MNFLNYRNFLLFVGFFLFLSGSNIVEAANVGDIVSFNVDKSFDVSSRIRVPAILIKVSSKLYFYVEKPWWDLQSQAKQNEILANLDNLSSEFDNNIYPTLTSTFGSEWNPGIDKDNRISVLFESMNSTEGGYFREADEYEKIQLPDSNEREMMYLSILNIDNPNIKIVLGHEFTHLITFGQKNKIFDAQEEVWLNEARADYSSTILGYDDKYEGSNLQRRVKDFIENPSDSITDWTNTKYDYASVNLFTHYVVDRYGINILIDSLKSKLIGVESINYALQKSGAKEDFSQVFTNWTIALAINDCSQNLKYCYSDQNFNDLKVNPTLIFLPLTGSSSLSATNVTKNWSSNWQKIIGGTGDLKLNFSNPTKLNFQMPYVIYDKSNDYSVKFLEFNKDEKGEINIEDFGIKYKSLIIIPSLQTKMSGFNGMDLIYPYSFTVSISGAISSDEQAIIQKLLEQIEDLKRQIADILAGRQTCSQLSNNLYPGTTNNEVKCLQQFLKEEGIYTGLISGNYGSSTKLAVANFQTRYLVPLMLGKTTGNVGPTTRAKINQILISR